MNTTSRPSTQLPLILAFLAFSLAAVQSSAKVLVYQHNTNNTAFNRYDATTNSWSGLGGLSSTRNNTQFATDILGNIFTYDDGPRRIYRYDPAINNWVDAGLPSVGITNSAGYNLKVTNSGRFLLTNYNNAYLRYSDGGSWSTNYLGFNPNLTADYDPTTDRYVIGITGQKRFVEVDVNNFSKTFSSYAGSSGEYRRMGSIVDGYLVENTSNQGIRRWNMNNLSSGTTWLPQPSGTDWLSSDVDRNTGTLYVNDYAGYRFGTVNVLTGAYTSLANSPTSSLSSLTVVNTDVILEGITTASRYNSTIDSLQIGGTSPGQLTIQDGTLTANSTVDIQANGTLIVNSGKALSATTIDNYGQVTVNGSLATVSGTIQNHPGATIQGTGSVGNLLNEGGIIAPGNSTGTLNAASSTWGPNGIYNFEVNDFAGTAGSNSLGWDLLNISGTLDITATLADPFVIDINSLTSGQVAGLANNFDPLQNYSLPIVTAAGGITGFDPSLFSIETTNFQNSNLSLTNFSISQSGNSLLLNFDPVPEPSTLLLGSLTCLGLLARRQRS